MFQSILRNFGYGAEQAEVATEFKHALARAHEAKESMRAMARERGEAVASSRELRRKLSMAPPVAGAGDE